MLGKLNFPLIAALCGVTVCQSEQSGLQARTSHYGAAISCDGLTRSVKDRATIGWVLGLFKGKVL